MNEIPATDRSVAAHSQASGQPAELAHDFGRYRVQRRIGDGRSSLFLATDETLGRSVALKVAAVPTSGGEPDFTRYMRGARAAAVLRCAGVAEVFDTSEIDGRSFIAREWIEGAPFVALLRRETLTLEERVRQIGQIAVVVAEVHRAGVVHGNLTSSNIIIDRNRKPVLIDFVDGAAVADDVHDLGSLLHATLTQHARRGMRTTGGSTRFVTGPGLVPINTARDLFIADSRSGLAAAAVRRPCRTAAHPRALMRRAGICCC